MSSVADMQGAGRIRRYVLEQNAFTVTHVAATIARSALHDLFYNLMKGMRAQPEIYETGACDLNRLDQVRGRTPVDNGLLDFTWAVT